MHELIFEGKQFISTGRAAREFEYAPDYIGQLCRSKKVEARLVGRSWYVSVDSLRAYLGLSDVLEKPEPAVLKAPEEKSLPAEIPLRHKIFSATEGLSYAADERPLFPELKKEAYPSAALFEESRQPDLPSFTRGKLIPSDLLSAVNTPAVIEQVNAFGDLHAPSLYRALRMVPLPLTAFLLSVACLASATGGTLLEQHFTPTRIAAEYDRASGILIRANAAIASLAPISDSLLHSFAAVTFSVRNPIAERSTHAPARADVKQPSPVLSNATTGIAPQTTHIAPIALRMPASIGTHTVRTQTPVARRMPASIGTRAVAVAAVSVAVIPHPSIVALQSKGVAAVGKTLSPSPLIVSKQLQGRPAIARSNAPQPIAATPAQTLPVSPSAGPRENATTQIIERAVSSGLTEAYVDQKLQELNNKLSSQIYAITALGSATGDRVVQQTTVIAQSSRIDQLSGTTISNPTVTGATITSSSFSGSVNATTLSVSSASATSTFAGPISGTTGTFSGAVTAGSLSVSGSFTLGGLTVTGNSSLSGNLSVGVNGLVYDSTTGNIGIATSSPYARLSVAGDVVAASYTATSSTATSTFAGGALFTRSPSLAHAFPSWSPGTTNSNLFDAALLINPASATADSNLLALGVGGSPKVLIDAEGDIFSNSITTTGTVNLSNTTASTLSVENDTTLGDSSTDTTTINGTLIITGTTTAATVAGNFGIGTSSPYARLSVAGAANDTTPLFSISSSTSSGTSTAILVDSVGRLGIGTTSPSAQLSVQGNGLFSGALAVTGTATSTFANGIQLTSGCFRLPDGSCAGSIQTFLNLTDTPSSYTANRIFFTNSGATGLTDSANFTFDGTKLTVSYASTTALSVSGTLYNSALTAGRVPFITTGGAFTDSSALTYNGTTLTVGYASTTAFTASGTGYFGNLGVGTSSPWKLLSVAGGTIYQSASGNPTLAGTYDTSGSAAGVYVSGHYAYVADEASGLQIIDVSKPTSPSLIGTYNTPGSAHHVFVANKYAYVADSSSGLEIIDVSNPTAPSLVGSVAIGDAEGVYVSGRYAYVADGSTGLQIVDISNPTSPRLAGTYTGSLNDRDVYVSGRYAYLVSDFTGLEIIDISNAASPVLVGTYTTSDETYGVYVSGRYAYVATGGSGLKIVSVSNPASPSLVGTYNTSDFASSVYVSGHYAYVADGTSGLNVIDISNPALPSLIGTYDTSGSAFDTYVSGRYAYVADETSGLQVVDINGADFPTLAAGNIETSDLNVTENIVAGNDIFALSGITSGTGGVFSRGPISSFIASTTQTNPISATFVGGNVGVGTTSPFTTLSVAGIGSFDNYVRSSYFIATSTLTSTFNYASSTSLSVSGAFYNSALTSGRLPFTTTGGALTDSASLVYNGTTLTVGYASTTAFTASGTGYFGSLGVGTTSPGSVFSIGNTNGINFSTATSTFSSTGGIDLASGCFSIRGICLGSGGGGTLSGTGVANQVAYFSGASALTSSSAFTFDGTKLTATYASSTALSVSGTLYDTALTSGRVPFITTGGAFTDSSSFTYNGTTLTAPVLSASSATATSTLSGGLTIESTGFVYDFSSNNVGIGTGAPSAQLTVNTTAGLNAFLVGSSTTQFIVNSLGNVGVGTSTPWQKFSVLNTAATAQVAISYDTTRYATFQVDSSGDLIVDPSGNNLRLNDDNLWVCAGGACPSGTPAGNGNAIVETALGIGTSTPSQQLGVLNNIYVAGGGSPAAGTATSTFAGDVRILGKLDVSTIDPVYTIDGVKYATYGVSSTGVKEETSLNVEANEKDPATGKYEYVIDFNDLPQGSDTWLFYQATDFGENWKNLVVTLTAGVDAVVHYEKDPTEGKLRISSSAAGEIAVRLIANRFDSAEWPNKRPDQGTGFTGFILKAKQKLLDAGF